MYTYTLEEIIENSLSNAYGLKDELLKEYLIKRYMILNKIYSVNKIEINAFSNFICDILYLKIDSGKFQYYDLWLPVSSYYETSISEMVSSWTILSYNNKMFSPTKNVAATISKIENDCAKIIDLGKRKANKIKGIYKKYYYDNIVLSELNKSYKVTPKFPIVSDIGPRKDKAFSERTYEEVCDAYVKAMVLESDDYTLVTEREVETFIYRNYEKYFPGTKLVGRQKQIGGGYIVDIMLSDDEFEYVLEIKNKKDDRLYWQANNYYTILNTSSKKQIKVITIAPEYSEEMKEMLKKLRYVDVKKFSLKIQNGKINDLTMENL